MTETDRQAITDAIHQIAWIFDHKQWDRMRDVFTVDAEGYGQQGLAAITANTIAYLGNCGPTQHLVGNLRIQLDGDTATSTSYVRAFHRSAKGKPEQHWDFLGEYHDTWTRTSDGWRLTRRVCLPIASLGDLVLPAEP